MIGQTLAHYKILEKIGSGGMGDVYQGIGEARQNTQHRCSVRTTTAVSFGVISDRG